MLQLMQTVCHRPDGLEDQIDCRSVASNVCHRPDGLEEPSQKASANLVVCHRPDGLEVMYMTLRKH